VSERPTEKAVLLTGAGGAIGQAVIERLEGAGFLVLTTDLVEIERPRHLRLDLSSGIPTASAEEIALKEFISSEAPSGLFAIVHNAAYQHLSDFREIRSNDFVKSVGVNVLAPLSLAQLFWDDLLESEGAFISISSIHANLTKRKFLAYSVTKSALTGLVRALSLESQGKIRVNGVAPAAIDTPMLRAGFKTGPEKMAQLSDMHPTGRIGTPGEVASLVLYLASEAPHFLNGAIIPLDGGISNVLKDPI